MTASLECASQPCCLVEVGSDKSALAFCRYTAAWCKSKRRCLPEGCIPSATAFWDIGVACMHVGVMSTCLVGQESCVWLVFKI